MGKEQFLTVPNRLGHHTSKWKESEQDPELLPAWIADMDFESLPAVRQAIRDYADQLVYGYTYPSEELYQAIQIVYHGGAMINPNIASKVFQIFSQMAQSNYTISVSEEYVSDLSLTEWRIIQQVGFGESNKEIAAKLFLSEGTIRNYLSTILSKLNLRDRTQLAIWSVQKGVTTKDFGTESDGR